ncbi:MAG: FtsX-like permease family protein [Candidatus Latescibacteria bacterium]|nr:FtsX-like permease family protein [Candidatus Latescibacterota bacterium]
MIRHLFRLAWNCRRGYALLGLEVLLSFLILSVIAVSALNELRIFYQPLGFDYRDVWWVHLQPKSSAADATIMPEVYRALDDFEEVEGVAADSSPPFAFHVSSNKGEYGRASAYFEYSMVSDRLDEVLKLNLVAGRWFTREDDALGEEPVVVTRKLAHTFFGEEDPLDKIISTKGFNGEEEALRVVGVVDYCRNKSPFEPEEPEFFLYRRVRGGRAAAEPQSYTPPIWFLIRVQPGTPHSFEKQIRERLAPVVRQWSIEVETLEGKRAMWINGATKLLIMRGVIVAFMLLMVALGLVGVLWQSVTQRTREIGIRRATGAEARHVYAQFTGEMLVLTTVAVVLGVVLVLNSAVLDLFPSVGVGIYTAGLLSAALVLYLLVIAAAMYPGWLATRVQPAQALHHE